MEKNVRMAILFDFYGDMLTDKQKQYFELYYSENLSLSEIAENDGISRQGVRDIIVRSENTLEEFEKKTGFVRKHMELLNDISALERDVTEIAQINASRFKNGRLLELCNSIYDRLQTMKE